VPIVYLNLRIFLTKNKALLLTVLVSVSIGFHLESISKGLLFDRKSFAIFFLLLGFYYVLNYRIISGYLLLTLAIFLHPLAGIASITFFLLPFLIFSYKNSYSKFPSLMIKSTILIVPIIILMYAKQYYALPISDHLISINDWYDYVARSEPDDAFMRFTLRENFVVSLLLIASYLNIKNPDSNSLLRVMFNVQIAILAIIVTVEILHSYDIFFGKISELFIGVQFRRGLWYAVLMSLVVIFRNSSMNSNKRSYSIIATVLVVMFSSMLVPDYAQIGSIVFALYVVHSSSNNFSNKRKIVFLFVILVAIAYSMHNYRISYPGYYLTTTFKYLIFACLLFIIYRIVRKYRDDFFSSYIVISLFCTAMFLNNLYKNDIVMPKYADLFNASDRNYHDQLKNHYLNTNAQVLEYQAIAETSKYNKNQSAILFSPAVLSYYSSTVPNGNLLFSRWDNTSIYSKDAYSYYYEKLKDVEINEETIKRSGGGRSNIIQSAIDRMDFGQIEKIKNKYNIGFIVRRMPIDAYNLIYKNDMYYVYML